MEKRFEIELPKEIMDVFLQVALGALCFFSSIKIIDFFNMVKKNNNWAVVVYAIVICLLIGIYFCINAAMKTLKRYYSKVPLEIVFYDDRLEVPSDSKNYYFFPDHEDRIIIFGAIKKISLKSSPETGVSWVRILYMDQRKLKKARISSSVFKDSVAFNDFVEHLRDKYPF